MVVPLRRLLLTSNVLEQPRSALGYLVLQDVSLHILTDVSTVVVRELLVVRVSAEESLEVLCPRKASIRNARDVNKFLLEQEDEDAIVWCVVILVGVSLLYEVDEVAAPLVVDTKNLCRCLQLILA